MDKRVGKALWVYKSSFLILVTVTLFALNQKERVEKTNVPQRAAWFIKKADSNGFSIQLG